VACLRDVGLILIFTSQGADLQAETTRTHLPLPAPYVHEAPRKITDNERSFEAFKTLRVARADARYEGARKIRAAKVCCSLAVTNMATQRILFFVEGGRGSKQEEVDLSSPPLITLHHAFRLPSYILLKAGCDKSYLGYHMHYVCSWTRLYCTASKLQAISMF
jgi:hypothetical protein